MIRSWAGAWAIVRARSLHFAVQFAVLTALALLLFGIADTTLENLDRLGIESGFEFLDKRAGFDVNQALFHYSSDSPVWHAFAIAFCNTLLLAVLSIGLATLLGLVVALFRISPDWFLRGLGLAFIETFRNIPALLQIFFWYFVVLRALPGSAASWSLGDAIVLNNRGLFLPGIEWSMSPGAAVVGATLLAALAVFAGIALHHRRLGDHAPQWPWLRHLAIATWFTALLLWCRANIEWQLPQPHRFGYVADLVITPELAALILGLSFYNASSVAEVIRAGLLAVPKGQWEAARSLGLTRTSVLSHVILPQALRVMVPPMTTCYLNIFKATSLGAAIGYPEIVSVMVGTTNNLVGRPVEIMFLVFAVYSLVSLLGIGLMDWLNRRSNRFLPA